MAVKKSRVSTSPHATVQHLIKAVGGANHVTLVDVSALLRSLEQKAAHFRQRGLEESSRLVAGDIRVLQAMVPRLVAGHPPIPGWERGKAYQIGDLITAENGVWRLTNGTGDKRNDWEPIWESAPAAKKSQTIDEEVAEQLRDLATWTESDEDDIAIEKRSIKRYQAAVKHAELKPEHLDAHVTFRMQLRTEAGLVEKVLDALNKRDERIGQLEKLAKDGFADFEQRLVKVAALQAEVETKAGEIEKFGELERRIGDLELKSRVVKTITNVVGWDAAGRITKTEKLEGRGEFIDAISKLAEIERRLTEVLEGSLVEVLEDEGRFVVRRWVKDGRVLHETRNQTKAPIFRGIYDHTRGYQPGDLISRGGSLWHTDVPCSGPFEPNNFTLCVKRGRDA